MQHAYAAASVSITKSGSNSFKEHRISHSQYLQQKWEFKATQSTEGSKPGHLHPADLFNRHKEATGNQLELLSCGSDYLAQVSVSEVSSRIGFF